MENLFDIPTDLGEWVFFLGAIVAFLIIFFLPSFVAIGRGHPTSVGVFIVNLFFGWTAIGWVAAFIWACVSKPVPPPSEPTKKRVEPQIGGFNIEQSEADTTKICPDCAEEVKVAARICRFCGHDFIPSSSDPGPSS